MTTVTPSAWLPPARDEVDGRLIVDDTGNVRPHASFDDPADPPYSRAVSCEIDEASRTVAG